MKTIKQIKEDYDNIFLSQVPEAPEDLVLEGRESDASKKPYSIPNMNQMPVTLLFRRIAYRMYPNKQIVALYYSKTVDKYLSIPFGPDGNLNLSESTVYNTLEELELAEGAKVIHRGTYDARRPLTQLFNLRYMMQTFNPYSPVLVMESPNPKHHEPITSL